MAGKRQEDIVELKERYIEYYRELPIQRYAAMSIGRNEDTVLLWKAADSEFSERVDAARSEWVKKKAAKSPAPWVLERLEREVFSPPTQKHGWDGEDPIKIVLEKYGITEAVANDRKDDDSVQGSSTHSTRA